MALVSAIFTAVTGRTDQTISTSSEPTTAQCIQYLNEACEWLVGICAENNSSIGRSQGSITTVDGTASYDDLDPLYTVSDYGWIVKTNSRDKIELTQEDSILDYSPAATAEGEPTHYYVDGSNNIVFLPTPDAAYSVIIPYWPMPTDLSLTTNTVPFNGVFDGLLIEFITMRIQNRNEYDLDFEYKWLQFLMTQAKRVISMRKGRSFGVGV